MVEKKKEISICAGKGEIYKIETFVEEICDQYNIFNHYFANIITSLVESVEIVNDFVSKTGEDVGHINIYFSSGRNGLTFTVKTGVGIFARKFLDEEVNDSDNDIQKHYLIIKYLGDEINISDDGKSCSIVFYISSINYDKTIERERLLQEYFNKIYITKKVE